MIISREKSSRGLAVALLVVGLVAGLAVGYFLQVPEVNRLNTELSASEDYRRELESIRADLETQVAGLQSSLNDSLQTITELQDSLRIAESDLDEAEDKIENQVTEIHGLLSERNRLKGTVSELEATVSDLEAVNLDGLAVLSWIGSQFTFEGMVTNHGTESAYDVHVVLIICQDDQIVFEQERWVADFAGREIESFEFSFTFSGAWDHWHWWIKADGLIFFMK